MNCWPTPAAGSTWLARPAGSPWSGGAGTGSLSRCTRSVSIPTRHRIGGRPGEPTDLEIGHPQRIHDGARLARPLLHAELIKGDHSAFRHARAERIDRREGRIVQVEIKVEQSDEQMLVLLDVLRHRPQCI